MTLTSCQINLYIIFFIIILLIALYYVNSNFKNIESFGTLDVPLPTYVTANIPTIPNTTKYKIQQNTPLSSVTPNIKGSDMSLQNIIDKNIITLSTILDKYKNIDVPIIVNNNNICADWGNYNNGKYKLNTNQCLNINGDRACVSGSDLGSGLVTCSNYYSDDYINKLNFIDTNKILNTVKQKISVNNSSVNNDIANMSSNIYIVLDDLINKRNLENQQLSFIAYNTNNINDKQNLVNESKFKFEKAENDITINQIEFANFLEDNRNHESKFNIYRKITIGIIITIVIMGILNILFSNLL